MDEFWETPSVYLWPKDHEPGESYPEDFWEKFRAAMRAIGVEWEARS